MRNKNNWRKTVKEKGKKQRKRKVWELIIRFLFSVILYRFTCWQILLTLNTVVVVVAVATVDTDAVEIGVVGWQ